MTTPQPSSAPRKVVIVLAATLGLFGCVVLLSGHDHAAPATVGTTLTSSTQLSSKSDKCKTSCGKPCVKSIWGTQCNQKEDCCDPSKAFFTDSEYGQVCHCRDNEATTTDLISKSEICRNQHYSNFWAQLGCS